LRCGLFGPQFFGTFGGKLKQSLAAVNKRGAQLLHLGVVSATLFSVRYSSLWLDISSASKDTLKDPEAIAEGMSLLLGELSCLLTSTLRC